MWIFKSSRHFIFCGVLGAVLQLVAGCAGVGGPGEAPSANVTRSQAWRDAEKVAAAGRGRVVALGAGGSMEPVYGDTTIVVIAPIRYADLRPGMTVVYRSASGLPVAHVLLGREHDGWEVKGLNNVRMDDEAVTPQNLMGVVYATFNYRAQDAGSAGPLRTP